MPGHRKIIINNQMLRRHYNELRQGDIVLGRVSLRPGEEHLLLDLVERGVLLIPAALPQVISRSKSMQADVFAAWMPPLTRSIHDVHQLLDAMAFFSSEEQVITKLESKNAGLGVHLWSSIEDVYTHATLGSLPFPFVLQPFHDGARDVRVIVIGDFIEAYERHNPVNFRNNLHFGGERRPWLLTDGQLEICRQVMARGKFPYAHIDLMITSDTEYLLEINLRGGIRGAAIGPQEYQEMVAARQQEILEELQGMENDLYPNPFVG